MFLSRYRLLTSAHCQQQLEELLKNLRKVLGVLEELPEVLEEPPEVLRVLKEPPEVLEEPLELQEELVEEPLGAPPATAGRLKPLSV